MKHIARSMFVLILFGLGITSYLAYAHFSNTEVSCPTEPQFNCNAVLNSSYSTFVGIPIAVVGFFVYLAILVALFIHEKKDNPKVDKVLLFLPALGVMAAGFYSALMLFRLGAICLWCEASHLTMFVLFIISACHVRPHWSFKKIFVVWILLMIFGGLGTFIVSPGQDNNPQIIALAKCLSSKDVKMYGAYWCPHCVEQKRLFGDAFKEINYVECADKSNPKVQLEVCSKSNIKNYPAWDFGGKRVSGTQDLETLAKLSGCEFS